MTSSGSGARRAASLSAAARTASSAAPARGGVVPYSSTGAAGSSSLSFSTKREGLRLFIAEQQRRQQPGDDAVGDRAEHARPEAGHHEARDERAHEPEQ